MKFTAYRQTLAALLLTLLYTLSGCQQTDEKAEAARAEATAPAATGAATEARPAPEFFVIPPDMAETRVWICMDEASDTFHTKHDCPVLVQCKGSFRNVTLVRAVEDFGRYNCHECSQQLGHIFDEDMVR